MVTPSKPPFALSPLGQSIPGIVRGIQNEICAGLESVETGAARFESKAWEREGGGGGDTRVIQGGEVFEKGGVNTSAVFGVLPDTMVKRFGSTCAEFFATGVSLVIHPKSPRVPTIHANFRYFEQPDRAWFGGGIDLTPYTLDEDSFVHFHQTMKTMCDGYRADAYADCKKQCDEYFRITHRGESRGIGGIFFDYVKQDLEKTRDFVATGGKAFLDSYLPIVTKNRALEFTARQKKFQLLRRGRYVEFNLVYDRGTIFGLQTKGNIESILMSLPPEVNYDYSADMETNLEERALTNWFKNPRESWI